MNIEDYYFCKSITRNEVFKSVFRDFKSLLLTDTHLEEVARKMLDLFYTKGLQLKDREHALCYLLAKCYIWKIKDSSLIGDVLKCLVDNTFVTYSDIPDSKKMKIFYYKLLKQILHDIKSCQNEEVLGDENGFLKYILFHANKAGFNWNGDNLACLLYGNVNSDINIITYAPKHFILLLQCGAHFHFDFTRDNYYILLSLILNTWKVFFEHCEREMKSVHREENNVLCLSYLLRAIPYFKRNIIQEIVDSIDHFSLQNVINDVMNSDLVPLLKERLTQPPELKNIAGYNVRKQLWKVLSLPDGIENLTVPSSLKSYLYLLVD